ncbi:MAG TPA: DinB family protein [Bryobacteraceae bacterium]|nr:DinB family protein [Bryobacteraceae bacterium]
MTHATPTKDRALRTQLIQLLRGGHAHATFDQVVRGFPLDRIGLRPEGAPHSAWELLEHMRIAQNDILRFSQSADYVSPKFPEGYWPASAAPERDSQWQASIRAFRKDLGEFEKMVLDPAQNLHRKFPWGDGQTLLREALLIADHNSYHLGQLALVRRLLGAWRA